MPAAAPKGEALLRLGGMGHLRVTRDNFKSSKDLECTRCGARGRVPAAAIESRMSVSELLVLVEQCHHDVREFVEAHTDCALTEKAALRAVAEAAHALITTPEEGTVVTWTEPRLVVAAVRLGEAVDAWRAVRCVTRVREVP